MKDFEWKFKLGLQTIILKLQYSRVLGDLETRKKKVFDTLEPYYKGQVIVLKYHLRQLEGLYGKKLLAECVVIAQIFSKKEGVDITKTLVNIMGKTKKKIEPEISIRKGEVVNGQ